MLNAGEVPNLFPLDEKQEICEKMRMLDRFVSLQSVLSCDVCIADAYNRSFVSREAAWSSGQDAGLRIRNPGFNPHPDHKLDLYHGIPKFQ